jgi:hypothetical protein
MALPRLLAIGLSVSWAGMAVAQPADPVFEEGRKLIESGDYPGACAKFQQTWDSAHSPGKAFNLSVCEEKQNHLRRAQSWMREGMLLLAKDDNRLSGAVERVQALEKRLPYVRVVVSPAADPEPVTSPVAMIDDQPVSTTESVPVDPGHHVVKLAATGRSGATVEIDLQEGERRDVPISPGALDVKVDPPPVVPKVAPPVEPSNAGRGQRIAGFVVGGAGLAVLGGALGMAILANATHEEFQDARSQNKPTDEIADRGRTVNIVEGTLLGVGGAALVTGIIVVLTAPKGASPPKRDGADLRLAPGLGPNGGGAWLFGHF